MNRSETAQLLAMCAALDQRTIGETDVVAWQAVLADVDLADAQAAVVSHYRSEERRIMPAHVRKMAAAARQDRIARQRGACGLLGCACGREPDPVGQAEVRQAIAGAFHSPDEVELSPEQTAARARAVREQTFGRSA